jgi:energy-converting hydrogenase Eha subunit H
MSITRMDVPLRWASSVLSRPNVLIWVVHLIIVFLCFLHNINEAVSAVLGFTWFLSAAVCVWLSKGRRARALAVVCLSAVAAQRALALFALTLSCLFGGECM